MVEVFKTNVAEACKAKELVDLLVLHFPESKINFDLEDCDKILRIGGFGSQVKTVIELIKKSGFYCQVLEEFFRHFSTVLSRVILF